MSVVRRCSAGAVVAGLVLLGGPAWAQESDPCAPGPDGSVPEMCQSGPVGEAPGEPEPAPEDPCEGSRPVEPGDGEVSEGDPGGPVGEPAGTEPEPVEDPEGAKDPEPTDPETVDDAPSTGETAPGAAGEDGVMCAFTAPVSAPAESAPGRTPTGGAVLESAPLTALPRTGPYDRLLALTAVGSALVVVGAGAAAAGRRRTT